MDEQLTFGVDQVFEIVGRGLILWGVSESQWNLIKPGDTCEVITSCQDRLLGTVDGVEWPSWIKKPQDPKYGVLVSQLEVTDKSALIGAQARIIPQD